MCMVQLSVYKKSTWIYEYFYILRNFFNPCIPFNGGVLVAHVFLVFCVLLLCVLTFLIPCCDVRYDFRIVTMFGSSLPPVVCRRVGFMSNLRYLCLLRHSSIQHILCCVLFVIVLCLVYLVLPVSLDGSFVIASSVFSNVYLLSTLLILISLG